jgi:hypothetical protein
VPGQYQFLVREALSGFAGMLHTRQVLAGLVGQPKQPCPLHTLLYLSQIKTSARTSARKSGQAFLAVPALGSQVTRATLDS